MLKISGQSHDAAAAERGAPSFEAMCAACHQSDGTGNPLLGAPNLTDDVWLYGGTAEAITHTLRHGRNGVMPSFGDILSDEQRHVLAAYVTALSRGDGE